MVLLLKGHPYCCSSFHVETFMSWWWRHIKIYIHSTHRHNGNFTNIGNKLMQSYQGRNGHKGNIRIRISKHETANMNFSSLGMWLRMGHTSFFPWSWYTVYEMKKGIWDADSTADLRIRDGKMCRRCGRVRAIFFLGCANLLGQCFKHCAILDSAIRPVL